MRDQPQHFPTGVLGALRLAQEASPFANSAIAYRYDALGRAISRGVGGDSETWTYDAIGRVIAHADDLGTFTRSFLGQTGQLTSQLSGAIGTQWSDRSNLADRRLTGIVNTPGASQFGYTTTPENDITAISQTTNPQTWNDSYDLADRLKKATTTAPGAAGYAYSYDAAGNLRGLQTPAGVKTVTANADNQVAAVGTTAFTYDAAGNLLADATRSYAWDAEHRLIGIAGSNGGVRYSTAISYDGLGRRIAIATTSGGVTSRTNYGWCGQALCQARAANDTPARRYLAEGECDAVQGGLVYGVDHLGSVRDVTSASTGQRTNHFDYDPYGNATSATGSRLTWADFRYAGLFYHQASGLYLATHRAYDPTIGRWLSRDPIGEQGGIKPYAFAGNEPVSRAAARSPARCGPCRTAGRDNGPHHPTPCRTC